jgi:flagella basal body P-ring formation protein FlgA
MTRPRRLSIVGTAARTAALCLALVCAAQRPAAAEELGVIPTRIIYPGETVAADSLQMARVRPGKPSTVIFAHEPRELIGKVAKRTLLPGRFVPLASVRDAYLVAQGAAVQVMFIEGGLTISMTAVTLEPGSAGDLVKVRNTDSGAVFSATVMADGTVRVGAS